MKKIISILITSIAILTCLSNVISYAAGTPVLKVTNASGQVGQRITVKVNFENSPGFGGMAYDVKFDNSILKLVSYTLDLGKTICTDSGVGTYSNKVNFQYGSTSNIEGDGTLVSFVFEILNTTATSTQVTVVPEDGSSFYYTGRVENDFTLSNATGTVTIKPKPVAVTGVSLNTTSVSMKTGEAKTLVATVAPSNATNKNVTWKSSKTSVATVDSTGKITAVKKGTATITVTTADGNKTASCTVNVACSHAKKTSTAAKPSTCKNKGWDAYSTCKACGQMFNASGAEISAIPYRALASHSYGTLKAEQPATHKSTGMKAHYVCSVCNKYFTSSKAETTQSALVIAKKAHDKVTVWTTDGLAHWHKCSCGEILDKANHSFKWVTDKAATEDATGLKHEECSVCKFKRSENTVIPKLDHKHTMVKTPGKTPTCKQTGNNEYYHCTKCDKYFKDQYGSTLTTVEAEQLPLADHKYEWKIDKAATVEAEGIKHEECTVCSVKRNENTTIPKLDVTVTEPVVTAPGAETTTVVPETEPVTEEPTVTTEGTAQAPSDDTTSGDVQSTDAVTTDGTNAGDGNGFPWVIVISVIAVCALAVISVIAIFKRKKV